MASVISSEVLYDRAQADGSRDIAFRYIAESNNSLQQTVDVGPLRGCPADFDEQAAMVQRAGYVIPNLAEQEKQWHAENAAQDTLWDDQGGFFTKAVPEWCTWDEASYAVLVYWLQREDKLDLVHLSAYLSHTSNNDLTSLLGITQQQVSDIRGDLQTAIDTVAALSTYEPWCDQNGVFRS